MIFATVLPFLQILRISNDFTSYSLERSEWKSESITFIRCSATGYGQFWPRLSLSLSISWTLSSSWNLTPRSRNGIIPLYVFDVSEKQFRESYKCTDACLHFENIPKSEFYLKWKRKIANNSVSIYFQGVSFEAGIGRITTFSTLLRFIEKKFNKCIFQ